MERHFTITGRSQRGIEFSGGRLEHGRKILTYRVATATSSPPAHVSPWSGSPWSGSSTRSGWSGMLRDNKKFSVYIYIFSLSLYIYIYILYIYTHQLMRLCRKCSQSMSGPDTDCRAGHTSLRGGLWQSPLTRWRCTILRRTMYGTCGMGHGHVNVRVPVSQAHGAGQGSAVVHRGSKSSSVAVNIMLIVMDCLLKFYSHWNDRCFVKQIINRLCV